MCNFLLLQMLKIITVISTLLMTVWETEEHYIVSIPATYKMELTVFTAPAYVTGRTLAVNRNITYRSL